MAVSSPSPLLLGAESEAAFTEAFDGREGCFYLLNVKTDEPLVFRKDQTEKPFPAGETLVLPLAIAAMELQVSSRPDLQAMNAWLPSLDRQATANLLKTWGFGQVPKKPVSQWPQTLLISPEAQAKFWAAFIQDKFELDHAGSQQLFEQLLDKNEAGYLLLGCSATLPEDQGAWYVGMVQMQENRLAFATWLGTGPEVTGAEARDITLQILQTLTRRRP